MCKKQLIKALIVVITGLIIGCDATEVTTGGAAPEGEVSKVWVSDLGNGNYKNPIIHADYSDPDVVRVGDDFYMTSSSFNCAPALPILHSKDLVNWTIVNYVFLNQEPLDVFDKPQHGNGVWAPSFRYHKGEFYIYYGDPDYGIYMTKTTNPAGEWTKPHLVQEGKGWIDPCPLWDDDGKAYLVHGWAGSRSGTKSILTVHEMSPDGKELLDYGVMVFDGHIHDRTVEGPKFMKKDGYYYILAPAGGVTEGWQLALRSKDVWGPYEKKVVLHQGDTEINGPHQGALVDTKSGESWFIHFQDKGAYGRIVHMQPVEWKDGWPLMGVDSNNDGIGEPVLEYKKPDVGQEYPVCTPQASDEFNEPVMGLQWQWHANPDQRFGAPSGRLGFFRLNAMPFDENRINIWDVPNLLMQKFTAEEFTATTKLTFFPSLENDKTGLTVFGEDYAYLGFIYKNEKLMLEYATCHDARTGGIEKSELITTLDTNEIYLQVQVSKGAKCQFAYSTDGKYFEKIGETLSAVPGRWIGAKVGYYCISGGVTNNLGYANIDWFRVE